MTIISITNQPTEFHYDSFGGCFLFPNGTIRVIKKLTIFGYKIKKQISSICSFCNDEISIYYNEWKNIN